MRLAVKNHGGRAASDGQRRTKNVGMVADPAAKVARPVEVAILAEAGVESRHAELEVRRQAEARGGKKDFRPKDGPPGQPRQAPKKLPRQANGPGVDGFLVIVVGEVRTRTEFERPRQCQSRDQWHSGARDVTFPLLPSTKTSDLESNRRRLSRVVLLPALENLVKRKEAAKGGRGVGDVPMLVHVRRKPVRRRLPWRRLKGTRSIKISCLFRTASMTKRHRLPQLVAPR